MRHALAKTAAAALAFALVLPLSGCFPTNAVEEVADDIADAAAGAEKAAQGFAEGATEWAEALSEMQAGKISRVVVIAAQTGDAVAEVTDQSAIAQALAPLSEVNSVAAAPETSEEYLFEVWQPRTVLAGESAADAEDVKVLELVTFEQSDVVRMTLEPTGISFCLSSPVTADSLRQLAR